MMTILVLQPERLIKQHYLESLPVYGEKRNPDKTEKLFAAQRIFYFAADESLPLFRFCLCVQPITDIEQRHGGEDRDETLHGFAVLSTERQNRLSREPGENARKEREHPAQMNVADRIGGARDLQHC